MNGNAADLLHAVYHVAAMGNWQEVVREQFASCARVGLEDLHVTFVGTGLDWLEQTAREHGVRIRVWRTDPNINHYETFAMLLIEELCKKDDKPILYFHTKGVSHPHDGNRARWRRLMQRHVVERWRDNLAYLADHDAVGVNWIAGHPHQHFSGTFWLARAAYLRKQEPFVTFHGNMQLVRYSCEFWIGWGKPRAKSLVCREQPFWDPNYNWDQIDPPETGRRINVGCGPFRLAGWENYDVEDRPAQAGGEWASWHGELTVIKDFASIDFGGAEKIFAGHVLEHLPIGRARAFMRKSATEAPAAELIIVLPVVDAVETWDKLQAVVFGGGEGGIYRGVNDANMHQTAWKRQHVVDFASEYYALVREDPECPYMVSRAPDQICLRCMNPK